MSRRKKSTVAYKFMRLDDVQPTPVIRTKAIYRQPNGRLGSSTRHLRLVPQDPVPPPSIQLQEPDVHVCDVNDGDFEMFNNLDDLEILMSQNDQQGAGDGRDADREPKKPCHHSVFKAIDEWLPYRADYLDELLRHDGCGSNDLVCSQTGCDQEGRYRCQDCFFGKLFCQKCLVHRHGDLPLHRIQCWTGEFFDDTSLQKIGFILQLGHKGGSCPSPSMIYHDFVVLDVSGSHLIDVQFCDCHHIRGASHPRIQLLRVGWLPASVVRPQTAFTFDLLNSFHLLTLQGKTSAYDYYLSLEHKTENVCIFVKGRYKQFLLAVRIWRHLKLLKRAGRSHDPAGIMATSPGQCAVECPACPHPGRNLPADWANPNKPDGWLYSLNLTVDANFRLKNKSRGISNDRPLGDGWGHWVPEGPYHNYLSQHGNQAEASISFERYIQPNLCQSDLRAVDHANTKSSQGYVSTGVGGVICARHGLVRKNGLGSLQKGERYANMDFILLFSLIGTAMLMRIMISYDIVCQWVRNFWKRMAQFPTTMQLPPQLFDRIKYVIPKFHIYAHGQTCQTKYSLNFLRYSARTDGEDPERWWSHINPVSMSTKEMGPGARLDTIDDHAAAWNWRKITSFGTLLAKKLQNALTMQTKHQELHEKLCRAISDELVQKWDRTVTEWDADPSKPNPYAEPQTSKSMTALRLELAKEDAARADELPSETSPSVFIQVGVGIEDQQRKLTLLVQGKHSTSEEADIQEKRNVLRQRVVSWLKLRKTYMQSVSTQETDNDDVDISGHPETVSLRLPSALPAATRNANPYDLAAIETRVRLAQAEDALHELRHLLRVTMGLWQFKHGKTDSGQKANTRMLTLINQFNNKVAVCANRYRAARDALLVLDPDGDWQPRFLELKKDDVKAPGRANNEAEGTRALTWIWLVDKRNTNLSCASDDEVAEDLQYEWAKSKARADRWSEEVTLLTEEMRRIVEFLAWQEKWWQEQATLRKNVSSEIANGIAAYSAKQAHIRKRLSLQFANRWSLLLRKSGVSAEWLDETLAKGNGIEPEAIGNLDAESDDIDIYAEEDETFIDMEL